MLWRVYIDEAGDRGVSSAATAHFAASALIVREAAHRTVRDELATLRAALGRQPEQTLHFQKFSHSQRLKAVQDLAQLSVDAITSVVLCKRGFSQPTPAGDVAYITRPDPMYLWAMRLLLERISWYVRDHGGGEAIVTFAHVRRFKVRKLHDYRAALEQSSTEVHWPSFAGHAFKVDAPHQVELLQLADTAASALFRAVEPDEFGNVERRYLEELSPKLYRRAPAPVTSYGLKVFPQSECDRDGSLSWLADV